MDRAQRRRARRRDAPDHCVGHDRPCRCEWRIVWDNSNIQESFNGITSPLSFSYAVAVYETVHRHTLRMIGVPEATLEGQQRRCAT